MGNKIQAWSALPGVICCLSWSQLKHTEKILQDLQEFIADKENLRTYCAAARQIQNTCNLK